MLLATSQSLALATGSSLRGPQPTPDTVRALRGPQPIKGPWPAAFPAKDLCSNCGLCLSSTGVRHVVDACAFLGDGMSRIEALEPVVHGRRRELEDSTLGEAHFGVHERIVLARGKLEDAQWTGVATGVALAWLESGAVDAVVVAGASSESFGAPAPILCRTADEVLRGRRVKPSLCPSLSILDEVKADASVRRLLFCGVGCAVQALRNVGARDAQTPEEALGLDALYVLRNQLFCEERMGKARADRHVPRFASAVQAPYAEQYKAMREGGGGGGAPLGDVGAQTRAWAEFFREALLL